MSLLVLAWTLRSLRYIVLTIACLAAALLGSVAALYPLVVAQPVPSFVVSLQIALVLAMSLDYSLFHLSTLQERLISRAERLADAAAAAHSKIGPPDAAQAPEAVEDGDASGVRIENLEREASPPPASAEMADLVFEVLQSAGHMIATSVRELFVCHLALFDRCSVTGFDARGVPLRPRLL